MRHDLHDGGWVDYRPVTGLKGADRTLISHYIRVTIMSTPGVDEDGNLPAAAATRHNITIGELRVRGMLARAVTAWSFPEPVPVIDEDTGEMTDAGSLEEIPLAALMAIEDLIAPHLRVLLRVPDPKDGPSETTSRSNGRSSARALTPKG